MLEAGGSTAILDIARPILTPAELSRWERITGCAGALASTEACILPIWDEALSAHPALAEPPPSPSLSSELWQKSRRRTTGVAPASVAPPKGYRATDRNFHDESLQDDIIQRVLAGLRGL